MGRIPSRRSLPQLRYDNNQIEFNELIIELCCVDNKNRADCFNDDQQMGLPDDVHHWQCRWHDRLCHFHIVQLGGHVDGHVRHCGRHRFRYDLFAGYRLCRLLLWEETRLGDGHRCLRFRIRHIRLRSRCCHAPRSFRLERSQSDPRRSHPQLRSTQ